MKNLCKYIRLVKQKPSVVTRVAKALFLTKVFKRKVLRGVEFAVTYQCQAKCEKCSSRGLIDSGRQEMSLEQILNISRQIVNAGAILINFTGGEPLLRNDIIHIIKTVSKMPVLVSLSTNGLLLTDTLLKELKEAGLNVLQIGLHSPNEEEHDAEVAVKGSYRSVLAGIKETRGLGIEVLINTVITREILYSERMIQLVHMAREYKSFLSMVLPAQVGGWKEKDVSLNHEDYKLIKKWLKSKFVTTDTESCYSRGICPAGTEKVYITPYGDMYPCPFIHEKQGNILNDNFIQLWKKMCTKRYSWCVNIK